MVPHGLAPMPCVDLNNCMCDLKVNSVVNALLSGLEVKEICHPILRH